MFFVTWWYTSLVREYDSNRTSRIPNDKPLERMRVAAEYSSRENYYVSHLQRSITTCFITQGCTLRYYVMTFQAIMITKLSPVRTLHSSIAQ